MDILLIHTRIRKYTRHAYIRVYALKMAFQLCWNRHSLTKLAYIIVFFTYMDAAQLSASISQTLKCIDEY